MPQKIVSALPFTRVEGAQHKLNEKHQQQKQTAKSHPDAINVQVGDKVRVKSLNQFGEVLSVSNGKTPLLVKVGNMQMRVSYGEIEPVHPADNKRELSTSILNVQYSKTGNVKNGVEPARKKGPRGLGGNR